MYTNPSRVFKELKILANDKILLIDDYHGHYDKDLISRYPVIIATSLGEKCSSLFVDELVSCSPDSFFIFISAEKNLLSLNDFPRRKAFYIPSAYAQYYRYIPECDLNLYDKKIVRKFLSLNRRSQWNRQALHQFLLQTNLIDDFYFSYLAEDRFGEGSKNLYDRINNIIGQVWYNQGLDLEEIYLKLPAVTGIDDVAGDICDNDWSFGNSKYYQDTFCSFVNETYIGENYDAFFTEKIFKPIKYGHPFFLFSSAHALALLRQMGFETFGDIFDESYDDIEDPNQRFEQLLREVKRICSLSMTEIQDIHQMMLPKIIHNKNFFAYEFQEIYARDIQNIISEIKDLIPAIV